MTKTEPRSMTFIKKTEIKSNNTNLNFNVGFSSFLYKWFKNLAKKLNLVELSLMISFVSGHFTSSGAGYGHVYDTADKCAGAATWKREHLSTEDDCSYSTNLSEV